ncbi:TraY domain-containing protein (plasmid) [Candidatus Fukatsuia symbiotica]|uniref:TraY domain-containing protein n=1 Tax=Candidatus Fukatsuia symbiotica TaxID=1878942 RepID=UPI0013C378A3|nr:TraY domain-containing protein [Candidatus Fukatsuia symbiotica]MEA9445854.1 TraY domain-containing protein [Candidatus Fukatsuia symbiotica]
MKKIALSIIHGNTVSDEIKPYYSTLYDKKLSTKLNDELSEALKKEATKNGWSLSKEMRFRLASSLIGDPSFYPDEVKKIRATRNSIDVLCL